MLRNFIHKPQQVFLRKALFQVHLWVGIFLALYVVLIGVSGSILVFREELQRWIGATPRFDSVALAAPAVDMAQVIEKIGKEYPKAKQTFLYSPREEVPVYQGFLREGQKSSTVYLDPQTGKVLAKQEFRETWLSWIGSLHYFLLLGRSPGLWLNGIGAALLLLLCLSGIVIWWPGIRQWKRGFLVDFSKSWKRINFDTHNVIGFWTLSIVSFWAISGVYFAWPREFTAFVNGISPVATSAARRIELPPAQGRQRAPFSQILASSVERMPGRYVKAVRFPATPKAPYMVYMTTDIHTSFSDADHLYFNPATGALVGQSIRPPGSARTAGDWIIWSMRPLHFGTEWGLGVKILYFLLGLSLPALVITGVLMYWNRYLGKKWTQLRQKPKASKLSPVVAEVPSLVTKLAAK